MFLKRGEQTQRILDAMKPMTVAREPETRTERPPLPNTCPNCGKRLGRGKWMHLKNCGKQNG